MNWHTQLLFTQKIIISNLPCIQKRPGNISNPSWSTRGLRCVYILLFNIQHISFKIHQVIGFYFEYQSYVRNLHFFVQIFMYITTTVDIAPISQHNKFLPKAYHINIYIKWRNGMPTETKSCLFTFVQIRLCVIDVVFVCL